MKTRCMKKWRQWLLPALLLSSMGSAIGQTTYNQVFKKVASDRAVNDQFGYSVAVDGDFAVVGAPYHTHGVTSCGSVYIFQRDAGGNWNQMQEIYASDRQANDHFGWSVSISGSYIIVGAPDQDNDGGLTNPMTSAGAIYIFKNNSGTWVQDYKIFAGDRETGDQFGWSVGMYGNNAVVGAPYQEDPGGTNEGAIYVITRNVSSGVWSIANKAKASDPEAEDHLGYSVAIYNTEIVAGAPDEDISGSSLNAGAAYTFMKVSGIWSPTQKLVPTTRRPGDRFGFSVARYSSSVVIGAPYHDYNADDSGSSTDAGAAYVFDKTGTWTQTKKIVASDRLSNDHFGWSVAKSNNDIVVGAPDDDQTNPTFLTNQGSAYVFNTKGDYTWIQTQMLKASDRETSDNFGISVAISGTRIFSGANNEDQNASGASTLSSAGSAYVYEGCAYSGTSYSTVASACIGEDLMFNALITFSETYRWQIKDGAGYRDIDPSYQSTDSIYDGYTTMFLTINNVPYCINGFEYRCKITSPCGAVHYLNYALTVDPTSFNLKTEVGAADGTLNDRFGDDVAISGTYAIVGSPYADDPSASNAGAAYMYERDMSGNWNQVAKLLATNLVVDGNFGAAVDIYGDYAVVGAPNEDISSSLQAGAVYVYQRISGTWTFVQKLTAPVLATDDVFGNSVAIDQQLQIVVGSKNEDQNSAGSGTLTDAGAAYVFSYSGSSWGATPYKIVASDRAAGDNLGWAVDIDGNNVIVSAINDDNIGSAYLFNKQSGIWVQVHKFEEMAYPSLGYGCSVSLYEGTAAIGAMYTPVYPTQNAEGSVFVYDLAPSYDLVQTITAPSPVINGNFGQDVSVSGNYMIIGANRVNALGKPIACGFIYERCWNSASPWDLLESLPTVGVGFSKSVDIAGAYFIVGGPLKNTSTGTAYVYESCGVPALKSAVINNNSTGVDAPAHADRSLLCYPNPAKDEMMISFKVQDDQTTSIAIMDINGRTISTQYLTVENTMIDVSGLTPGIYFIQVTFEGGQMTHKFIKQ